jgi:hypothetical protein
VRNAEGGRERILSAARRRRRHAANGATLAPSFSPTMTEIASCRRRVGPARKRSIVMSRLAIALVLALATTAANAQDAAPAPSHRPAVASPNATQPFLFDGRMRGDGVRPGARADDRHPNAGTIVVQPPGGQPARE